MEALTSLDSHFCIECLEEALEKGKPEIFNTDQGSQFTSSKFTSVLKNSNIKISMDGKGRALDNVFIERFWRSVKYEYVYLNTPESVPELYQGLGGYFTYYNEVRPHQSLKYKMPSELYR